MPSCIYKITNSINQKSYVGFTTKNPEIRWKSHQHKKLKTHFSRAIQKYGWDNFLCEVIYVSIDEVHCLEMENYFITQFDTLNSGYNSTTGGKFFKHTGRSKQKISDAQSNGKSHRLGKHHTTETKQRISKSVSNSLLGGGIKIPNRPEFLDMKRFLFNKTIAKYYVVNDEYIKRWSKFHNIRCSNKPPYDVI